MSINTHTRSWSLHRRLIIGLILCIGSIFAVLAPILDHWIDYELYQRMDLTLMQRASAIARVLESRDISQLETLMPEYNLYGHTEFFTVFNENGQAVFNSPSSAGTALPKGQDQQGTPRYYNVTLPDGHSGRALAIRLAGQASPQPTTLVVATERSGWDLTERRIHLTLLGSIALATLLATALAVGIVHRLIRSLRKAGDVAAMLRSDTPAVPFNGNFPRELQPFIDAFNQGVSHLYNAIDRERRFSRDVAHELRTPLTEIRLTAESALLGHDPEHARQSLKNVILACERMQRGVNTLLLIAQLESGHHNLALDPLDLAALTRELIAHRTQPEKSIRPLIKAHTPPSAWIQSDLGVVERILSNLLSNALEYSPDGDCVICSIDQTEAGWTWSISNAAPELDASDLEHFGHRFWRKRPEGGTAQHAGLGLALALGLSRAINVPLRFELRQQRLTALLGPWPALG
jgi:two-component system sensor histidine kinase QseC